MNRDDLIYQAWLDATNCYRAGMKLPPLKNLPEPEILDGRELEYTDQDEPDRYRSEDERLDSEQHDQCVAGKFKETR